MGVTARFCLQWLLRGVLMALAVAVALPGRAALAEEAALRGIALVVGQARYEHLPALKNPATDARMIAGLLGDLGFEVSTVLDADATRLERALRRFAEDAQGHDVAVVYYAGHGIEAGGENFLVPVDAGADRPTGAGAAFARAGAAEGRDAGDDPSARRLPHQPFRAGHDDRFGRCAASARVGCRPWRAARRGGADAGRRPPPTRWAR